MLASSSAEKPIRKLALAKIRNSPTLQRQYRSARGGWPRTALVLIATGLALTVGPVVIFLLPSLAGAVLAKCRQRSDALLVIALASFCALIVATIHGNWLRRELARSTNVALLGQIPMSDRDYLRNRTCGSLGLTLVFLVVCLAYVGGVSLQAGLNATQTGAVFGLAILQWVMVVSLSLILSTWLPGLGIGKAFIGLTPGVLATIVIAGAVALPFQGAVVMDFLLKITPTAWPLLMMYDGFLAPGGASWWMCIPAGALTVTAIGSYMWLERRYVVDEISFESGNVGVALAGQQAMISDRLLGESAHEAAEESFTELVYANFVESDGTDYLAIEYTPAEATLRVRSGDFLERDGWTESGVIERLVASVLTDRERVAVEVLTGGTPVWTKSLITGTALATVGMLLLYVLDALFQMRLFALGWHVALFGLFGTLQNTWPAAIWKSGDELTCPGTSLLPFAQAEMDRVAIVTGTVRALCLLPYSAGMALALIYGANGQLEVVRSLYLGVKTSLVYLALHQWWFTNAQINAFALSLPSWQSIKDIFVGGLCFALSLSGGIGLFMAGGSKAWSLLASSAMFSGGWLAQRYQHWRLLHGPIDFIAQNPEANAASFGLQSHGSR